MKIVDKLEELGYSIRSDEWGWKAKEKYGNIVYQCIDISKAGIMLSYVSTRPNDIQTQQNIDDIQIAFNRL